jgi:putative ABC transport system permease protein
MIKKQFIIALRTFRHNKLFSLINILGLSVGISAALVIYLITQYDFSFEKFQKDGSRIYRIVTLSQFSGTSYPNSGVPYPLTAAVRKDLSGIEESAWFFTGGISKTAIPKAGSGPLVFKAEPGILYADDHYFRLFPFYQWIAGSPSSLVAPFQTVISESRAKIYFPGLPLSQVVGKTVIYDDSLPCKVAGVVKDLQENTDLQFKDFVSLTTMSHSAQSDQANTDWGSVTSSSQLFVRLSPGTNSRAIERQLAGLRLKYSGDKDNKDMSSKTTQLMQPLADIHFSGPYDNFDQRQANKPTLYGLLLVAVFLLALGSINFINLTTAQAAKRTKEIGIRKTMGSSGGQLIFQFLSEAFLLTLVSGLLSLALTPWLLKVFSDFTPSGLSFDLPHRPDILFFLAGLIVTVSFLSGFYPALILSRLKPVLVLKNQAYTGTSLTRRAALRKTLTIFQFVIAQVFIMGTFLVSKQISYALNKDMGFKKEAIVFFRTPYQAAHAEIKQALLKDKLTRLPGIDLVSLGGAPPAADGTWSRGLTYKDGKKEIKTDVQLKNTDSNYVRLYGLHLLAGHIAEKSDSPQQLVINQTYAHILGFNDPQQALGKAIGANVIVGVMADFHQASLHKPIKALALITGGNDRYFVHIALQKPGAGNSNWSATLTQIGRAFKEVYPEDEFEYHFFDDSIAKFYTEEQHIARLLVWATGLTIFISCLGLLGLVIYSTQLRIKEIGIRKVLGASILQIVSILSKDFVKLVGIAFLIAVPIAWWGIGKWLENFAYRTTISWWIFPLSGGSMVLIALLIMCFRTVGAANANPVNSLRSE